MKPYQIRLAQTEDIPFIYSTWLKATKYDSHVGLSVRKGVFFESYRLVIDHILAGSSQVLVACKPDEPNVIFAYLVSEPGILHFAFTKESFWRLGIQKDLFNQSFPDLGTGSVLCTHHTHTADNLLRNHPQIVYNPFVLYKNS